MTHSVACAVIAGAALALAVTNPARAQTEVPVQARGITAYPPGYFERSQPSTALEMVVLLPGFRLQEGNSDLRGYAGAAANVLIDGQRPASKQEALEQLLRRIPAQSIERIELIGSADAGFDMQGHTLIANVVRKSGAAVRGRMEGEYARFSHGFDAPKIAGEISYGSGARLFELSGTIYREIDDEHGFGSRNRTAPDGSLLRRNAYGQPEGETVKQLSGAYRQDLFGGKLRVNALFKDTRKFADITNRISLPVAELIVGSERKHTQATEAGMHFERALSGGSGLEIVAIRRDTKLRATDRSVEVRDEEINRESSDASETILRGVLRTNAGPFAVETGVEAARNILDVRTALEENGNPIFLPGANVRVAEDRAEGFVTLSWRPAARLAIETGVRGEVSRLTQSGDSDLSRSLAFLKPRMLAAWTPSGVDTVRILIEREVGQLDFGDFVSSASLSAGTVTAGNRDLEPDSLWRGELAWERRLGKGSLVLTARHEAIGNVVDRIPVVTTAGVFDAVGNIGSGVRQELQADLNLPLDGMGVRGITVQAHMTARRSRVTDPTTGARRMISDDLPFEGTVSLTHDLPRLNLRWGVNTVFATEQRQYKIAEVQSDRLGTRIDAFIEYKPGKGWTLRLFGKNLTDSAAIRDRHVFPGLRGNGAIERYLERRELRSGAYYGLSVQRAFGS